MRKLTQLLIAASFPALLLANISMAAETGSALKNDSIRFEPFADAKVTGTLNLATSKVKEKRRLGAFTFSQTWKL
jgi:hypothetical protein